MTVQIPDEFLMCRDTLHAWDPYDAHISRGKTSRRKEIRQVLRCTRCQTLKTRTMTTAGELLGNSYTYPDGYLLKDHGALSPADRGWIRMRNLEVAFTLSENGSSS
jgi:hypothetical protein